MKNIIKLLIPIVVVVVIFFSFTAWQKNYDIRYTDSHQASAIIIKKEIRPEGMYSTSYVVGRIVRFTESWSPEKFMITVDLNGKKHLSEVDKTFYNSLMKNEEIQIWYQTPKYYGDPFNIKILNPENPSQLEALETMMESFKK